MANVIRDTFENFGLPPPEHGYEVGDGDVYNAVGGRKLVFLSPWGLVIRLTPRLSLFTKEHPHFLKSLYNRTAADGWALDIDPGLHSPVTEEEKNEIYNGLYNRFGISVKDDKEENLSFVPTTRYPVMLDLDPQRITIAPPHPRRIRYQMKELAVIDWDKPANFQETFYTPLRDIIRSAWPLNSTRPDKSGLREFFSAAQEFRQSGRLMSCWDAKTAYRDINLNAASYAQKLRSLDLAA